MYINIACLMSIVFEYEMYMPRAHLIKGALRPRYHHHHHHHHHQPMRFTYGISPWGGGGGGGGGRGGGGGGIDRLLPRDCTS